MRKIRRRRSVEEPERNDRWMLSYADFITVLLAFFVALFASLDRDTQSVGKLSQAIHSGFQQLEPLSGGQNTNGVASPNLAQGRSALPLGMRSENPTGNAATDATAVDIEELRRQLEAVIGQEIRNGEVTLQVTPEGFVISLKELGFFDSGQAVLRPGAAAKIERIARVLSQHGFNLRVEGHSDDQPIHTVQFRSNWQLSTARATAVLLLLVDDSELDPRKISLAGYGQYRPIADNSTAEGRKLNRRIDLVAVGTAGPRLRVLKTSR